MLIVRWKVFTITLMDNLWSQSNMVNLLGWLILSLFSVVDSSQWRSCMCEWVHERWIVVLTKILLVNHRGNMCSWQSLNLLSNLTDWHESLWLMVLERWVVLKWDNCLMLGLW